MATSLIEPERITALNNGEPVAGRHVLYWMQASVRTRDNHALEHAARTANDLGLPLLVGFGIDPDYEEATGRSMLFLLQGLSDVAQTLARRRIGFAARKGAPLEVALDLATEAAAVVTDRNYLRRPRRWRHNLASQIEAPVEEVEANVVVPVEVASSQREYAARTIRPKLGKHVERFTVELNPTPLDRAFKGRVDALSVESPEALARELGIDPSQTTPFRGGEHQAYATLERFIDEGLPRYESADIGVDGSASSHLSMYLHFGHISPIEILRRVRTAAAPSASVDGFVEELVVRRELAHNFVWFEPDYDTFAALPEWARTTLEGHRDDPRPLVYTIGEMEAGATSDRYWNAAMTEMRETGYLHNRMRMYWGKRILEWTNTPTYAYRAALTLNNRYLLDGRDPNSYANVGWVFGLHDQAFGEREIFGKVRPMTMGGLERKIDADRYVEHVEDLTGVKID